MALAPEFGSLIAKAKEIPRTENRGNVDPTTKVVVGDQSVLSALCYTNGITGFDATNIASSLFVLV